MARKKILENSPVAQRPTVDQNKLAGSLARRDTTTEPIARVRRVRAKSKKRSTDLVVPSSETSTALGLPSAAPRRRSAPMTPDLKELVSRGLSKGLTDRAISRTLEGVSQAMVFNLRKQYGITSEQVLRNRHDTWIRLIESGKELEEIGRLYEVKPMSIKQALWQYRSYSFRMAKAKLEKLRASQVAERVKRKTSKPFSW